MLDMWRRHTSLCFVWDSFCHLVQSFFVGRTSEALPCSNLGFKVWETCVLMPNFDDILQFGLFGKWRTKLCFCRENLTINHLTLMIISLTLKWIQTYASVFFISLVDWEWNRLKWLDILGCDGSQLHFFCFVQVEISIFLPLDLSRGQWTRKFRIVLVVFWIDLYFSCEARVFS